MNCLLRVEAVNLSNFVYDTNKIQPMRGGGYLLLEAVQGLADNHFAGVKLESISTGASIGLFRFASDDPQGVCNAVLKHLRKATGGHATFVVDWVQKGDFEKDLQLLTAKNRWRQYQQPTLVLPLSAGNEECYYDGLRPGVVEIIMPEDNEKKKAMLSGSVDFRRETGGKLRKNIYRKILGEEVTRTFTEDLHELAACEGKGNLNNKIAFIYLDGNKFTKVRTDHCKDEKNSLNSARLWKLPARRSSRNCFYLLTKIFH